ALQQTREGEQRRQLMLVIHERLHRLAGTAGTFGFTTLGQQARLLEQRADRWLEATKPSGQALTAFVRAIRLWTAETQTRPPENLPDTLPESHEQLQAGCRIFLLESDPDAGHEMCQTL